MELARLSSGVARKPVSTQSTADDKYFIETDIKTHSIIDVLPNHLRWIPEMTGKQDHRLLVLLPGSGFTTCNTRMITPRLTPEVIRYTLVICWQRASVNTSDEQFSNSLTNT